MKKFLLFLGVLLFSFVPSFAANEDDYDVSNKVIVEATADISTNSKEILKFKVAEKVCLDNVGIFEKGDIIEAKISDIIPPKRGKRNGYLILKPLKYITEEKEHQFKDENLIAKVIDYRPFDVKNAALKVGVSVTGLFVKAFSPIFYLGQGIIKPEEDEGRIKSGFKNVYKNSPLAYIEEGKPAEFKEGDVLVLKFSSED